MPFPKTESYTFHSSSPTNVSLIVKFRITYKFNLNVCLRFFTLKIQFNLRWNKYTNDYYAKRFIGSCIGCYYAHKGSRYGYKCQHPEEVSFEIFSAADVDSSIGQQRDAKAEGSCLLLLLSSWRLHLSFRVCLIFRPAYLSIGRCCWVFFV